MGLVAAVDVHGFQDCVVAADAASDQADVGQGVVGAAVGAAGPVDGDGAGQGQAGVQGAGGFGGAGFGFNLGEVAVVNAGAADGAAGDGGRAVRKVLQQRFGGQIVQAGVGDVGDDQVLAGGDADGAVAVAVGQVGDAAQLRGSDAPGRNA